MSLNFLPDAQQVSSEATAVPLCCFPQRLSFYPCQWSCSVRFMFFFMFFIFFKIRLLGAYLWNRDEKFLDWASVLLKRKQKRQRTGGYKAYFEDKWKIPWCSIPPFWGGTEHRMILENEPKWRSEAYKIGILEKNRKTWDAQSKNKCAFYALYRIKVFGLSIKRSKWCLSFPGKSWLLNRVNDEKLQWTKRALSQTCVGDAQRRNQLWPSFENFSGSIRDN